jgi:hypothetical protein
MQAGQQSVALPSTAISTTAGAYSPSLGYYQASYPFMAQWGQTMSNAYNQNLAAYNAGEASGGGAGALAGAGIGALGQIGGAYAGSEGGSKTISGFFSSKGGMIPHLGHGGTLGTILGTVGRIGGKVIGSIYGGPIGGMIGGKLGGMAGDTLGDVASGNSQYIGEDVGQDAMPTGGDAMSLWAADGGDVTQPSNNYVDPNMSPSKGAITDDVPARLQAGEFVFPEDVVAWRGEQWMHKEIMKARQEREKTTAQSGAEPEMGPAIDTQQPPNFVSEGARV